MKKKQEEVFVDEIDDEDEEEPLTEAEIEELKNDPGIQAIERMLKEAAARLALDPFPEFLPHYVDPDKLKRKKDK